MPWIFTKAAISLVEKLEGLWLHAYRDTGGVWTVGYGHTGPDVPHNTSITVERAQELLMQDLAHAMEAVTEVLTFEDNTVVPTTNNQFSAYVILAYNIGSNAFENSSLADYLDFCQNSPPASAQLFSLWRRWNKVKGVVVQGLVNRREAEIQLWSTVDDPS